MYDLKEPIEMTLPSPDGEKICLVRLPTSEEWIKRYNTRINQIRNLGNGVTDSNVMNREKADAELLSAIQLNKNEVIFDESEAVTLIEQLANCDVVNVEKVGRTYEITLQTILGDVKHVVSIPMHSELKKTIENVVKARGGRFNTTTIHMNIAPAEGLYDKIFNSVDGYSSADKKDIPIIHKYKVIDVIQGEIGNITAKSKVTGTGDFPQAPGQTSPA